MATEASERRRGKRPPHGEPVVDRAFRVLDAFDSGHREITLSTLSRRSGLPLSTTRRLAERLVAWGALEQRGDGRFVIGLRLYEVASLAPRGLGLREVAAPYVDDLFVVTREHVQLAVLDGSRVVLIERRSRRGAVAVEYRVGGKLPIVTTALGQVLVAGLPAASRRRALGSCSHPDDLVALKQPELVERTLASVRRAGVAIVRRRTPESIVAVAAPVVGPSLDVVAALSIVIPGHLDPERFEPAVRTAARGIGRALAVPTRRTDRERSTREGERPRAR